MNKVLTRVNLRGTMRAMEVGDTFRVDAAVAQSSVVRNAASLVGLDYGRKYSVSYNRALAYFTVTRTA